MVLMSLLKITGLHTPLCMRKHPWVIHREMCQNQNQCLPSADLGSLIGFGWTESWNAQSLGEGCFLTSKTENELHKPSRPLHKPKEEDNRKKKQTPGTSEGLKADRELRSSVGWTEVKVDA